MSKEYQIISIERHHQEGDYHFVDTALRVMRMITDGWDLSSTTANGDQITFTLERDTPDVVDAITDAIESLTFMLNADVYGISPANGVGEELTRILDRLEAYKAEQHGKAQQSRLQSDALKTAINRRNQLIAERDALKEQLADAEAHRDSCARVLLDVTNGRSILKEALESIADGDDLLWGEYLHNNQIIFSHGKAHVAIARHALAQLKDGNS